MQRFAFFHIPKTAGTTLMEHLYRHTGYTRQEMPTLNRDHRDLMRRRGEPYWPAERDIAAGRRVKAIVGHAVCRRAVQQMGDPADIFCFTFLRDPVSRFVSGYNYALARGRVPEDCSFADFAKARGSMMMRMILYYGLNDMPLEDVEAEYWVCEPALQTMSDPVGRSMAVLRAFDFIGFQETFERDSKLVMDRLGLPPVTGHENVAPPQGRVRVDAETAEIVAEYAAEDVAIYEQAWAMYGRAGACPAAG